MPYLKIIQKKYGNLDINDSEKDVVKVNNSPGREIIVERKNLHEFINQLENCLLPNTPLNTPTP